MKSSSKKACSAIGPEVAYGRFNESDDALDTDSPFVIDAWPNPSKDKFNILVASPFEDDDVDLEILGISGERIFSIKTQSNVVVEVDASRYPAGVYLVKAKQLMYNQTLKLSNNDHD